MGDPFRCNVCGRWLRDYEDLELHLATVHASDCACGMDPRWHILAAAMPNYPAPQGIDPRYLGPTCPWCGRVTASDLAWGNDDGIHEGLDGLPEWNEADNGRLCWGECGDHQAALDAIRAAYVAGGWMDYGADDDDLLGVIRELLVALHAAHGEPISAPRLEPPIDRDGPTDVVISAT